MTTKIRLLHDTVGIPTGAVAVTQSASDNTTKVATTAYVTTALANLADSAPSTLNTLNELAAALGDDANFSTTVTNSIATKLPLAGGTMTGNLVINTAGNSLPSVSLSHSNASADNFILTGGVPGTSNAGFSIRDVDASANRLVINNAGFVGIGRDTPAYLLHVRKDVDSFVMKVENDGNSAGTSGASYADASDGLWVDTRWNTSTNTPFKVTSNSGNTPMMIIKGDGKVGIGTGNPAAAKLDIVSVDNSNTIAVVNIQNNMDNSREALRITSLGDYDAHMAFFADGATDYWGGFGIDYSDAGKFKLQTDNILSNGTNLMTWARDGKVGIGTTNPGAHLHVDGVGPIIKLGSYSFITEDIEDNDSLGFWTHTTESILFGQTSNALTSQNVTCRIDNNGILRPTRFRLPASALPTSALAAGELHVDTGDSNKVKVYDGSAWISLNNAALGEAGNAAADGAALLAESASNGSYYFDHDGTEYQTYYIGDVLGGGWQLAMCVTNGATAGTGYTGTGVADWFNGDTTIGAGNTGVSATGTNWFTASNSSELNVTSMTALNKTNSRGRGFFKSFTNMMIRQNIGGTVGYRSYVLNASNSLYSWFQTADHTGFTNRTSSSSTAGSGVTTNNSTAIRLSNIDFNYQLNNDGGRIVTSGGVVTESSGGVACRVDGHRGYNWVGNVVNDYTARAYSNNGRLNDHTLWIFVK